MKTLVLGASPNSQRFSYKAVKSLVRHGYEVVAVGIRDGEIGDIKIHTDNPHFDDIDTITMYVGPKNQKNLYDYIFSLNPKRIIFNPGAENFELDKLARDRGIKVIEACTLVMLNNGNY